ncbi:DUF2975 domain-containing protein [Pseudactinotalea terrae]|uniref:DUF2975 domain-containing protein n=1 Tax=Pseudactinotalea terrae TaxID=1743262 RepID=UPI0012E20A2E|nr:DUF2975 domain-containing protein [Pseudactinotalea terrae]
MLPTRTLRVLLIALVFVVLLGLVVLFQLGDETARQFPEVARWTTPVFLGIALGTVPVFAGMTVTWGLLTVIDRGEAFSDDAIRRLRTLRLLIAASAVWFTIGLIGMLALGLGHPSVLIVWFAAEAVGLFLFTLVALLERLFASGARYRTDSELTV